ncbi:hypothetical protein ABEF92_002553 [Exophiala dermatitidis]|uniref:Ribonuclease P subunit P14 n=1 Tax=Exophiala dermatitidis (strain ATCC 34100 / CBS 525.76 / NIH/UT8656) TaxID=858893 RepID=H6BL17_EXODN|nr:ribonuclease P subunit P14 [Exophiala dermatitidis NIH/UT8656]EHY52765.1 ribonuclease P subunit P14 [Exophiala dermatitidis NIH/UT8656]
MVRIKHRYLLFNILYPSESSSSSTSKHSSTTSGTVTTSANSKSSSSVPSQQILPPYLLFSRPSPAHLTPQLLIQTLKATITQVFGDHGLGATQAGIRVVYFSPSTSTCILRVPRAYFRLVWASLTYMDTIPPPTKTSRYESTSTGGSTRCVIRVVRVSGTIRKSEEEVMRRARYEIVRAKRDGLEMNMGDGRGSGDGNEASALLDGWIGKKPQNLAGRAAIGAQVRGEDDGNDYDDDIDDDDDDEDMDDLSE